MRENRTHGSEGGESGSTGLPYPYYAVATKWLEKLNFKNSRFGLRIIRVSSLWLRPCRSVWQHRKSLFS